MNSRHLRIFLTVCEAGSMTKAARQLYMTQPSVSQSISELEREYAVRLFERMNHHLYLTEAGQQLRSYASHILNLSDQAKKQLAELGSAGSLRVGASQTVGAYLLPQILRKYHEQNPAVDLFSVVDNTRVIEGMLLEDQIDLGVVEGSIQSKYIQQERLCSDELVIVCGQGHPFWNEHILGLSDLAEQGFIIREAGSGTRALFEKVMQAAGVDWKRSGVYSNTESIKKATIEGLSLAAVPKISIIDEEQRGLLKTIRVEGLELSRDFNLIYHHQKYFTAAIQSFVATCRQFTSA